MKIAISAESTIDLTKEILDEFKITTIPYNILLGEESAIDGEITPKEIFAYVDQYKVLPKTSAINKYQFGEYFSQLLKENDAVIHFTLSSDISCTYQNALEVSKEMKNVYIVDSKSLSTGIALLAIKASKLAQNGKDVNEILEIIKNDVSNVQASFVLNKLDYLKKGGRCSSLALLGANLLKIRPQILVKNGKMVSGKKYRGTFESCVKNYCEDTLKEFPNFDDSLAFVTYTSAPKECEDCAVECLKKAGFKDIRVTYAGGTISSHCGPNTLGILFIKK